MQQQCWAVYAFMSKLFILMSVVTVAVCYLCFTHTFLVIRGACFIASICMAIMAYCFFEHAILFRDKWQTATSGKRRTPPKESVISGIILLTLAIALMVFCFRFEPR